MRTQRVSPIKLLHDSEAKDDKIQAETQARQREEDAKNVTKHLGLPNNFKDYNRMIGNPISKINHKPQDMAQFQIDYDFAINHFHLVEYDKARKMGATETANRSISKNCFDRYLGHDVMIIAGNKSDISKEIMKRFNELFFNKKHEDGNYAFKDQYRNKWTYDEIIRRASLEGDSPIIEFTNDTRVFAFAASRSGKSQSFRGTDDVICAFLSEAAHTGMTEDQPLMDALLPNLAQRDDADLIMESTPNGKRGFFWNYWFATMLKLCEIFKKPVSWAMENHQGLVNMLWQNLKEASKLTYFPLMTDYTVGLREKILSQKFIDKMKNDPNLDFEQEFCCKFTTSQTAAFEILQPENYLDGEKSIDLSTLLK